MKKLLLIIVTSLPLVAGASLFDLLAARQAKVNPILALNPAAWYRGEDNVLDSSGLNRHAAWVNTAGYTNGMVERAFSLGIMDMSYVDAPSIVSVKSGQSFTVSCFFRLREAPSAISAWVWTLRSENYRGVGLGVVTDRRLQTHIRSDSAHPSTAFADRLLMSLDTWYHIVVRNDVDSGKISTWINGVFHHELDTIQIAATTICQIGLGPIAGSLDIVMKGDVDEWLLFTYALSQAEIEMLANKDNYPK